MKLVIPALAAGALLLAGCTTESEMRHEGVTAYAGNAIAANTALQIVDPWEYGVQDTDLKTPAVRPSAANAAADSGSSSSSSASSSGKP